MADKKVKVEEPMMADAPYEGSNAPDENGEPHVVQHLDRDPNDPRNAVPTPKLPSLNDEGQS